jgi:hypothetical protein
MDVVRMFCTLVGRKLKNRHDKFGTEDKPGPCRCCFIVDEKITILPAKLAKMADAGSSVTTIVRDETHSKEDPRFFCPLHITNYDIATITDKQALVKIELIRKMIGQLPRQLQGHIIQESDTPAVDKLQKRLYREMKSIPKIKDLPVDAEVIQ